MTQPVNHANPSHLPPEPEGAPNGLFANARLFLSSLLPTSNVNNAVVHAPRLEPSPSGVASSVFSLALPSTNPVKAALAFFTLLQLPRGVSGADETAAQQATQPAVISDLNGLQQLADHGGVKANDTVEIVNDIDASNLEGSIPHINGTLNGNGHTIHHLKMPLSGNVGANGTVSNLTLAEANIQACGDLKAVGAIANTVEGKIKHALVTNSTIQCENTQAVGGVVGQAHKHSHLLNVTAQHNVLENRRYVGGVAGELYTLDKDIEGHLVTVNNLRSTNNQISGEHVGGVVGSVTCMGQGGMISASDLESSNNTLTVMCREASSQGSVGGIYGSGSRVGLNERLTSSHNQIVNGCNGMAGGVVGYMQGKSDGNFKSHYLGLTVDSNEFNTAENATTGTLLGLAKTNAKVDFKDANISCYHGERRLGAKESGAEVQFINNHIHYKDRTTTTDSTFTTPSTTTSPIPSTTSSTRSVTSIRETSVPDYTTEDVPVIDFNIPALAIGALGGVVTAGAFATAAAAGASWYNGWQNNERGMRLLTRPARDLANAVRKVCPPLNRRQGRQERTGDIEEGMSLVENEMISNDDAQESRIENAGYTRKLLCFDRSEVHEELSEKVKEKLDRSAEIMLVTLSDLKLSQYSSEALQMTLDDHVFLMTDPKLLARIKMLDLKMDINKVVNAITTELDSRNDLQLSRIRF